MTITLRAAPDDKIIELGGGSRPQFHPNVDIRMCYDEAGNRTVDFTADFNEPLPVNSDEWDGVYSHFLLEHVSYRKIPQFLAEVFRILKPGGKAVIVTANTEAQVKWAEANPQGWDGRTFFDSVSGLLYGDQDYPENSHRCYFSPKILEELFAQAGFSPVKTTPYGARDTDIVVEATKPKPPDPEMAKADAFTTILGQMQTTEGRAALFDKHYFNGGKKVGGYRSLYRDEPSNEMVYRHVMARKPQSVLELGCSRGYVLKRLEDGNPLMPVLGVDISRHCYLSRVSDQVVLKDIVETPWPVWDKQFDLCLAVGVLDRVPEPFLPTVVSEIRRTCKRVLVGVDTSWDGFDRTQVTVRPLEWWRGFDWGFPAEHIEIVTRESLEHNVGFDLHDYLAGDGKVKLNVGSFTTMFHHGWTNIDLEDLEAWAQPRGYRFQRHDVRTGLPYGTSSVDLVFACHFLEHLNYAQGLDFLRECRRVLKSSGALRLIVPDAGWLGRWNEGGTVGTEVPDFNAYGEISDTCEAAPTWFAKYWAMLHEHHSAGYDYDTLADLLRRADLVPFPASFRRTAASHDDIKQILRETLDLMPSHSLYVDALTPQRG